MSWKVDPAHTQVEFSARHMGIMTVKGRFQKFDATIDFDESDFTKSSVVATVEAASVSTADERRDGHLKSADFFEAEKHANITFKSTSIHKGEHERYRMTGDLTIRGVTKPVTLDVVYSGQGKDPWGNMHAGFSAEGTINRKDWGLEWNRPLETGGFLVGDEIKVMLEVEAVQQAEAAA
ncbi:MAG: YceI family protein [Chloroflexota bacterium]|nr:YceI family protein [Chloroflexota bacterium]